MLNYSFYNLKFRSQFLIAIIFVPLFLLVVLNMVVSILPISNENEIKSYVAKHTSSTLLENLDRNFVERYGDVISFSGLETTIKAINKNEYSEKLSLEMNKLIQNYPVYDLMMAVNLKGEVIACNTKDYLDNKINFNFLKSQNFANTNWFLQSINPLNKIWISDLQVNSDSKKIYQQSGLGISFSAPIKNDKGKTIGVWYNLASWSRIEEANRKVLLKTLTKIYKNSSIVLTTNDNKIIDTENHKNFFLDFNFLIKQTQHKDNELINNKYAIEFATEKGIGAYKGLNWKCYTLIPKSKISFSLFFTPNLLLIDFLVIVFTLLIAFFWSKYLSERLNILKLKIEDISIGKIDNDTNKIIGNDEINDIAKSVEKLALNIKMMAEYATEIGKGNFNSSFSPISEFDVLGKSLISMSNSIQENALKITEESNKTAHALKVKSEFLSTISHELRTPLNAIIGTVDLLLQESSSKEIKESLNIIKFSSNNLNSIITNILDFNTMNSGKFDLEEIPINLRSLIKNTYLSFLNQSKEKNLEFNLNFENTPEDLLIVSDPSRLNQILSNLISNAIKFTEKGYIEMNIFITEQNEGNCKINFSISDTGIGINEEYLNYIFEVFTQQDSSITRKHAGLGIGLVITKGILDSYNSKMKVISKVGIGTKFSFEIGFKSINNQISFPEIFNEKTKILDGKKFLIVDDNKINLIVISKIISKYNSTLDTASNGLLALEKYKTNPNFDIILMDLQMPVMDGYEASKHIKKLNPNIPIIAVTGEAILDIKSKILEAGIDDYIIKPINPELLINKINKFISK